MMIDFSFLQKIRTICLQAGEKILSYYKQPLNIQTKENGTHVTKADLLSEQLITTELLKLTPTYPILAEEAVESGKKIDLPGDTYWCIDPLDGTNGFIKENDMFCISIALIHQSYPILGAIYAPVLDKGWIGAQHQIYQFSSTQELYSRPLDQQKIKNNSYKMVSSRRSEKNIEKIKALYQIKNHFFQASVLKFISLLDKKADFYPVFNPTCQWDSAGGQAILEAAGGYVVTLDGQRLKYEKYAYLNPPYCAFFDFDFYGPEKFKDEIKNFIQCK